MTTFIYAFPRKYVTIVETKKGSVVVEFLPAVYFGHIENATYSTNNPEIIEALKKSTDFGSLISIREQTEDVKVAETPIATTPESSLSNPAEAIYEDSVTSAATATLWLQKTHGEVFSSSKVADMKIEAARKYNTIFPNWK